MQGAVETLGEGNLLIVLERLAAKHQHAVLIHAAAQGFQRGAVMHAAQVDGADFSREQRVQGSK